MWDSVNRLIKLCETNPQNRYPNQGSTIGITKNYSNQESTNTNKISITYQNKEFINKVTDDSPDKKLYDGGTCKNVYPLESTGENVKYEENSAGSAGPLQVVRSTSSDGRSGGQRIPAGAVKFMAVVTRGGTLPRGHAHVCGAYVGTWFEKNGTWTYDGQPRVRPALDQGGDAVRRADVYTVDTAIISMKDFDVWDFENRTLERKDRFRILQNLRDYVDENGGVIDDCKFELYPTAVSELYSPPRLTAKARSLGLRPGLAIDLDTGWDLSVPAQQKAAAQHIEDEDPELLMMSPECKRFSQLQALNDQRRDPNVVDDEFHRARRHLRFCRRMARQRYDKGKGFAFEAPWSAGTWKEDDVKEILSWPGVRLVRTDMCAHGMIVPSLGRGGIQEGLFNKKPTGILTNVDEIAEVMAKARCPDNHQHGDLIGGTARQAQVYPDKFCKAILTGLRKHLERRGALRRVSLGLTVEAPVPDVNNGYSLGEQIADLIVERVKWEVPDDVDILQRVAAYPASAWDDARRAEEAERNLQDMDWSTREPVVGEDPFMDELDRIDEDQSMKEPTPQEKREILKIHKALAHPKNVELARALRHTGAKPHLVRWARHGLQCPVCLARPRPKAP